MGERVISTFLDLVKINSTSRNEAEIRLYLVKVLKGLGLKTRVDRRGNIHAILQGVMHQGPVLLFNAHMDTVVPGNNVKPILKKDRITSDGTTILGADDKAGLAGIIEMIRILRQKKVLFKQIKIIFTVEEEIGLQGAKALKYDDVEADYCFVLDSDGDVGSIVVKAPAQEQMQVKITGRAAHAGLNPEDGISAIKVASLAIAKLKIGRIDKETTANIGIIKGGTATNIIAEELTLKAEARSHNEEKLYRQIKLMANTFTETAIKYGATAEIQTKRSYNKVSISPDSEIAQIAGLAAKALKLKHKVLASGGGSDASVIYSFGIPTIALCIGMEQVHSKKEYITLKNLATLPHYLVELVRQASAYARA